MLEVEGVFKRMNLEKEKLRKEALKRRTQIIDKAKKDKIIQEKLLNIINDKNILNILIYVSKDLEVDTLSLIKKLLLLGKKVYVPRIENKLMDFYLLGSIANLKLGKFQILEPTGNTKFQDFQNCCMIVPGLLFDLEGNRLGYGGGYYDRYLSDKNIYKIGICYQEFQVLKLKTDKYDIKMDEVVTEV